MLEVLPAALSFTLLGAVESLLSAKVADGMTGRKHRYNMEVVAQGIANVASAIVRRHQRDRHDRPHRDQYSRRRMQPGLRHGACASSCWCSCWSRAPLASFIPLSALAGVLVVVCWNMAEKEEFVRLLRDWRGACVLLATFGLTLIEDLTFGIIAGCVLAAAFALADRVMRSRRTEA